MLRPKQKKKSEMVHKGKSMEKRKKMSSALQILLTAENLYGNAPNTYE